MSLKNKFPEEAYAQVQHPGTSCRQKMRRDLHMLEVRCCAVSGRLSVRQVCLGGIQTPGHRIGYYRLLQSRGRFAEQSKNPSASITSGNFSSKSNKKDCVWSCSREGRWFLKAVRSPVISISQQVRGRDKAHRRKYFRRQFQRIRHSLHGRRARAPYPEEEQKTSWLTQL